MRLLTSRGIVRSDSRSAQDGKAVSRTAADSAISRRTTPHGHAAPHGSATPHGHATLHGSTTPRPLTSLTSQKRLSVLLVFALVLLALLAWAVTFAYGAGGAGGVLGASQGASGAGGTASGDTATGGMASSGTAAGGTVARISDAEGNTHELFLNQDGQLSIVTSEGSNLVVVRAGEVFVEEADCPGGDCTRQGRISRPGQTIVCLPHRLVVEIVGSSQ